MRCDFYKLSRVNCAFPLIVSNRLIFFRVHVVQVLRTAEEVLLRCFHRWFQLMFETMTDFVVTLSRLMVRAIQRLLHFYFRFFFLSVRALCLLAFTWKLILKSNHRLFCSFVAAQFLGINDRFALFAIFTTNGFSVAEIHELVWTKRNGIACTPYVTVFVQPKLLVCKLWLWV